MKPNTQPDARPAAGTKQAPASRGVHIYDTTLRDGTQREGVSLSAIDKMHIAHLLDGLGIELIELGWPGSNPKDAEAFERARDVDWSGATIAAFGSTRKGGVSADTDPQVAALLATGAKVCTVFGKGSMLHVREVLRVTAEENLRMVSDTVKYLVSCGRRVIYDSEHFFDGYKADPAYALETLRAAAEAGAETVVVCDTNGGSLPWEIEDWVREVVGALGGCPVGVHTHDDAGCGVANAIAGVRAGAVQVQGTINGYGERCGNANLVSIIADLELKMGVRCLLDGALAQLTHVSRQIAEIANLAPDMHAPYVGRSAFAHKGGVHVAAIRRHPRAYDTALGQL
jgi:2-isopropylmalate synthase